MNSDLFIASELLKEGGYTCVMCNGNTLYTSRERGVKPLLDRLYDGVILDGFSVADKVVGKAPAFLYVLLGVKRVYALVMTEVAKQMLSDYGIEAASESIVNAINNRSKTGLCPMELAVTYDTEPHTALKHIQNKLIEMNNQ